jgi:coatomer subunit beta
MLIMTSIIRIGKSEFPTSQIDEDSHDRILTCLRVLASLPQDTMMKDVFLVDCRHAYSQLIQAEERKTKEQQAKDKKIVKIHTDDMISFRHLKSKKALGGVGDEVILFTCLCLV